MRRFSLMRSFHWYWWQYSSFIRQPPVHTNTAKTNHKSKAMEQHDDDPRWQRGNDDNDDTIQIVDFIRKSKTKTDLHAYNTARLHIL